MTDTVNLHNAIKGMYDEQLSKEKVFEAGNNFIGFFELLVSIDKHGKSQTKSTENKQNYECLHKQYNKGSRK